MEDQGKADAQASEGEAGAEEPARLKTLNFFVIALRSRRGIKSTICLDNLNARVLGLSLLNDVSARLSV